MKNDYWYYTDWKKVFAYSIFFRFHAKFIQYTDTEINAMYSNWNIAKKQYFFYLFNSSFMYKIFSKEIGCASTFLTLYSKRIHLSGNMKFHIWLMNQLKYFFLFIYERNHDYYIGSHRNPYWNCPVLTYLFAITKRKTFIKRYL